MARVTQYVGGSNHNWNVKWTKILMYNTAYLLTPWSRILEELTGSQLVKKFPTFYGTRRLITHSQVPATCPYPEPDQSSPCPSPTSWRFSLILSSHLCLGLPNGLFPSDFSNRTLYAPLLSPIRRLRLKCDGTDAETRFRLSTKRTSPFKSAGASVQSTTGSRGVHISGSNTG